MELQRFRHLLDAYGADLRLWPEPERAPGRALLAISSDAVRARDEALRLDRLLERAAPAISDAAVARILARVATPGPQRPGTSAATIGAGPLRSWASAALLAGMAVLGLVVGVAEPDRDRDASASSDLVELVLNADLGAGGFGL